MKILILDPDWRFGAQTRRYFESLAHLVVLQSHGNDAIRKIDRWQPDLVVVAAELAQDGLLEHLHTGEHRPAVLLTGWMDRYDRVWRAWQKGGHELLMKPVFNTEEIHQATITALENAAAGTRTRQVAASA